MSVGCVTLGTVRDDESDLDAVAAALLDVIPADVTTGPQGEPLDAETIADVRRIRARDWAKAGHRDPQRVRAWIAAGVVNQHVARLAEKRGYRPGDPWVPKGFGATVPTGEWSERDAMYEKPAGRIRALQNRRRAARSWFEQQARIAASNAELQGVSDIIRDQGTPGSGSGNYLIALDYAAFGGGNVDPDLVAGALLDLVDQARATRRLGEETRDRLGDPLAPAWLEREMTARRMPNYDVPPLADYDGPPEQWLRAQGRVWREYVDYLLLELNEVVDKHLAELTEPERLTAQQHLDTARADCHGAREAWTRIADEA